jgi:hypothetical protein
MRMILSPKCCRAAIRAGSHKLAAECSPGQTFFDPLNDRHPRNPLCSARLPGTLTRALEGARVKKRNLFYAQSGGVTAVINATACGVIETARKHKDRIGKIYAGRNGIVGALREELIDTGKEKAKDIAALRHTPGGAFGSVRYKLKGIEESARGVRAPDRGVPRPRHRLLHLQRRRRLHGYRQQGRPGRQVHGLRHHLRRRAEDRGQRPAGHRQLPRLRLGGQVRRRVHPGGRHRRRLHARRPRCSSSRSWAAMPAGSPPPAALAGKDRSESAAPDPVPGDRLRRGPLPRQVRDNVERYGTA